MKNHTKNSNCDLRQLAEMFEVVMGRFVKIAGGSRNALTLVLLFSLERTPKVPIFRSKNCSVHLTPPSRRTGAMASEVAQLFNLYNIFIYMFMLLVIYKVNKWPNGGPSRGRALLADHSEPHPLVLIRPMHPVQEVRSRQRVERLKQQQLQTQLSLRGILCFYLFSCRGWHQHLRWWDLRFRADASTMAL